MTRNEREVNSMQEQGRVSASQIQLYLKGVNYPASKQDIVSAAQKNGAPSNVMSFINRLPDKQYGGPNMVEEEFGKMK